LRLRHLLEAHDLVINMLRVAKGLMLRTGAAVVDATLIAAPSSDKSAEGERDAEMHQVQWSFGMKAHIARGCCIERTERNGMISVR
jgi:IS5 family transposase